MSNRQVLVTETYLENIADAIREKNGLSNTYTPGQMAAAIQAIETEPELETININANGTYRPSGGVDGFDVVFVQVPTLIASVTSDAIVLTGEQATVTNNAIEIDTRQQGGD